jgi:AbrB family looped-hinge helix DNA binding protein
MRTEIRDNNRVYRSRVDSSGRIVLPADVRQHHRIHTGDQVVIIEGDDGLQVKTQEQALREARALFATLAPPDVLLSEELIRERREAAKHE